MRQKLSPSRRSTVRLAPQPARASPRIPLSDTACSSALVVAGILERKGDGHLERKQREENTHSQDAATSSWRRTPPEPTRGSLSSSLPIVSLRHSFTRGRCGTVNRQTNGCQKTRQSISYHCSARANTNNNNKDRIIRCSCSFRIRNPHSVRLLRPALRLSANPARSEPGSVKEPTDTRRHAQTRRQMLSACVPSLLPSQLKSLRHTSLTAFVSPV